VYEERSEVGRPSQTVGREAASQPGLSGAAPPGQDEPTIVIEDEALRLGFTQLPNYLFQIRGLSHGAKLTYALILSYAWQHEYCFPGQDLLARDLEVSTRSVIEYLKELVAQNLIRIQRRGLGRTNIYHVLRYPPTPLPTPVPTPVPSTPVPPHAPVVAATSRTRPTPATSRTRPTPAKTRTPRGSAGASHQEVRRGSLTEMKPTSLQGVTPTSHPDMQPTARPELQDVAAPQVQPASRKENVPRARHTKEDPGQQTGSRSAPVAVVAAGFSEVNDEPMRRRPSKGVQDASRATSSPPFEDGAVRIARAALQAYGVRGERLLAELTADPGEVLAQVERLQDELERDAVANPAGWLVQAIRDRYRLSAGPIMQGMKAPLPFSGDDGQDARPHDDLARNTAGTDDTATEGGEVMTSHGTAWDSIRAELRVELTAENYERWFAPTVALSYVGTRLTIGVPDAFDQQWLDRRLRATVERVVARVLGDTSVEFVVADRAIA